MQLEENFLRRVSSLVRDSDLDFWREGRFLVRTDNQLVTYKDGIHNYYFCVTLFLLVWGHPLVFWLCVRFSWYEICIPGMTRISKSWRAWNTPELTLVTPIAVVGGRKTSLVLKGRNLTIPGTQWVFPDVKIVSDLTILLWMFATHHELCIYAGSTVQVQESIYQKRCYAPRIRVLYMMIQVSRPLTYRENQILFLGVALLRFVWP
jgi:hypothetical protein